MISILEIPSHQPEGSILMGHPPLFITARLWRQPGLNQKSHNTTCVVTRQGTALPSWEMFLPLIFQRHTAQLPARTRLNLHLPCVFQATVTPRRCLVIPDMWKPKAHDKGKHPEGNIMKTNKNPTGEYSWSVSPSQGGIEAVQLCQLSDTQESLWSLS